MQFIGINKASFPMKKLALFSGSANQPLAHAIAKILNIPLGEITASRFSDSEIMIEILENVRHKDVFIIQPTCPPVNDHLMELILIANAIRRASAARITAVIPYFGYARQNQSNAITATPTSAKIVAQMLETAGINKVLTVDLHAEKITGFFKIPCINLYVSSILALDINKQGLNNYSLVAPDLGSITRSKILATLLGNTKLSIIYKARLYPNTTIITKIIGNIQGSNCILIDDIVDTANTICTAAKILKTQGANQIYAYCTHPVLSGEALQNIPLSAAAQNCSKIRHLSIAAIIAGAIEHAISKYPDAHRS